MSFQKQRGSKFPSIKVNRLLCFTIPRDIFSHCLPGKKRFVLACIVSKFEAFPLLLNNFEVVVLFTT